MARLVTSYPYISCCECSTVEGPSSYAHPCGCPRVTQIYRMATLDVRMCGYTEFRGGANEVEWSVPPKRYRRMEEINVRTFSDAYAFSVCLTPINCSLHVGGGIWLLRPGYSSVSGFIRTYPSDNYTPPCGPMETVGIESEPGPPAHSSPCIVDNGFSYLEPGYTNYPGFDEWETTGTVPESPTVRRRVTTERIQIRTWQGTVKFYLPTLSFDSDGRQCSNAGSYLYSSAGSGPAPIQENTTETTETLSMEDTDEDAITRAIASSSEWDLPPEDWPIFWNPDLYDDSTEEWWDPNPYPTSRWPLRTDNPGDYQIFKSCVTIRVRNLQHGIKYSGCFILQRREAYEETPPDGANLEWEDISQEMIEEFERNPEEDEPTYAVENAVLPFEEGWEFRVKPNSYKIWPSNGPCQCPEMETEETEE